MLKTGLTAIMGVIILQTGAMAQVYVKNTGNVGIGVTNPTAKLELPDAGSASLRVGVKTNMANCHTQLINSLAVVGESGTMITSSGAVANDFYNNGSNPTWSGTILFHYGSSLSGNLYNNIKVDKSNLGVLHFQNESNGVIAASGSVYIGAGYNTTATFHANNNVAIGYEADVIPNYKLQVNGSLWASNVHTSAGDYPDYVFDSTYQLPTLQEVETYIKQNHHLPEVPTEADVKKVGINLGEHQVILLKKVEELTLYAIEQNKKQQEQSEKLQQLEKNMAELMEVNNKLQEELINVKSKRKKDNRK